jgi:hypothetical protein
VGSKGFIETIKEKLGILAKERKMLETDRDFQLREEMEPILPIMISKMTILGIKTHIIGVLIW